MPVEFVLFIIAGQSNAKGIAPLDANTITLPPSICYKYQGGVLSEVTSGEIGGTSGSAWKAFAQEFYEQTGMGCVFVPLAIGGTAQTDKTAAHYSVDSWDVGGTLRATIPVRRLEAISALESAGICWRQGALLWCQGELDAKAIGLGVVTANEYSLALSGMLQWIRSPSGVSISTLPVIISMTGAFEDGSFSSGIAAVYGKQRRACFDDPHTHCGYSSAKTFVARGMMANQAHYTQAAYNEIGVSMARVAARIGII